MSEDPIRDDAPTGDSGSPEIPPTEDVGDVADLKREVERLRMQLARVTAEAETYRRAAYVTLNEQFPYVPPTEEEIHDLVYGLRGRSILDLIDELEREGGG